MIKENISYGYDYDLDKNLLIARKEISNYGFFSSFTLLITALMNSYKEYKNLPEIDGSNLLRILFKNENEDGYKHFFHIDENSRINFEEHIPVPLTNDDQHTLYKEEYAKYYNAFFKRYFNFNPSIEEKINKIIQKYEIDLNKTISVVYRSTDKWTDMGGFNHISPALYFRLAKKLKEENEDCKVLIQCEKENIKAAFCSGINGSISIEETLTTYADNAPLFATLRDNVLDWSEYYMAALYICSKSKYLITYTGNSAFFMYLNRGTTNNMYQEITFTKNESFDDFFVKNN